MLVMKWILKKDFGHLINTQNIKKYLNNIKGNQVQYQNENREYLEGVRVLWRKLKDTQKSFPCI